MQQLVKVQLSTESSIALDDCALSVANIANLAKRKPVSGIELLNAGVVLVSTLAQ